MFYEWVELWSIVTNEETAFSANYNRTQLKVQVRALSLNLSPKPGLTDANFKRCPLTNPLHIHWRILIAHCASRRYSITTERRTHISFEWATSSGSLRDNRPVAAFNLPLGRIPNVSRMEFAIAYRIRSNYEEECVFIFDSIINIEMIPITGK